MFKLVKLQDWIINYRIIAFMVFVAVGWILCWVSVIIFSALFL